MSAETAISRLVAAADRATLSDRPTPAHIADLDLRMTQALAWLTGWAAAPRSQPVGFLFMSLVTAAEIYLEDRTAANAKALGYICRAAHRVDAMMQGGEL